MNGYMAFLLFSVAGLACAFSFSVVVDPQGLTDWLIRKVVRFVGSTLYMIIRLFAGE